MPGVWQTQPRRVPLNQIGGSDAIFRIGVQGLRSDFMLRNLRGESYVRRLLAIGAVTMAILAAFALGSGTALPRVSAAPAHPGNAIQLGLISSATRGCKLGPGLGFCEQVPGTTGPVTYFSFLIRSAVNGVVVTEAAIPGLEANFAPGDFAITSNTCTGNFAASQDCAFDLAFSPTTIGLREAAITVSDSEGDSQTVNVQGTGSQLALAPPAPPVGCTPSPFFGNAFRYCAAAVGTVSTAETFTIDTGAGATGVNVALKPIAGLESEFTASDFTIENTTCTGALPANGSCTIGLAFTPATSGTRSAALTATDSNGDSTTIYVTGATTSGVDFQSGGGISNPVPCGQVNLFDYCNLPVGGISFQINTFTLQNTSGTQITGLSVPKGSVFAQGATASDFTVQSTSCSSVLASGASCNISVAFTPTASGLRQGAIVITDAQGDIATLNLAGYGDDYSITTQLPTEISVIPGGTITFNATLTPDSVFGMNGEQVTFSCPTSLPTDTSCAISPCPAMITPGTPVSVTMTIVTSSAKVIAPVPSAGCSSYGPSSAELIGPPPTKRPGPPAPGAAANKSSTVYPALLILAAFGGIGLLISLFATPGSAAPRRRISLLIAGAGLAAAILAGCHHHGAAVTDATPIGETVLTFQGTALDSSGNSLNAARSFQATLDVVTK
jgi:Cep192 domain 4